MVGIWTSATRYVPKIPPSAAAISEMGVFPKFGLGEPGYQTSIVLKDKLTEWAAS